MQRDSVKNLEVALVFSALLHIAFLYALRANALHMPRASRQPENYIELSRAVPDHAAKAARPAQERERKVRKQRARRKLVIKNQIVDIPRPLAQREPKKAAYLSNWSQRVKEEMVSRHKGGGYGTDSRESLAIAAKPQVPAGSRGSVAQVPPQPTPLTGREGLAADTGRVSPMRRENAAGTRGGAGSGSNKELALNSLLPSYSRMRSIPGIGDNNYLPGLREGDVTLLNTKSFVYAGFVRRVAYRIFDQFVFDIRNSDMTADEINSIDSHAYVEANMDKTGNLISVKLLRSSGSAAWDRMAMAACRRATWDANPPRGAEGKDGVIHFVFAPGRDVLVVGLLD